jgi:putative selenate reductase
VGYESEGDPIAEDRRFHRGLKDASGTEAWAECMDWSRANLDRFSGRRSVSPRHFAQHLLVSRCPRCTAARRQIERIAVYLLREKKLHTYVKCNPTLLGYDFARRRSTARLRLHLLRRRAFQE